VRVLKLLSQKTFLIIASKARSLINFRGELINEILGRGCSVVAVAPDFDVDEQTVVELRSQGVITRQIPLSRTGFNPFADLLTFFSLFILFFKFRPTVVLAYTIKPVVYGMLAAKFARVPQRVAIITGLGFAFADSTVGLSGKIARFLYRLACGAAKLVFFQNPDDMGLFARRGMVGSEKSRLVNGSGVNLDHFTSCPLPDGPPSFLMIARLVRDKGVGEYLAAAARTRSIYPDVQFHLVGYLDSNPTSITQQELDEAVKSYNIKYWGPLDDVRPAIQAASVYVLPSYREGTPRTVLEAMAMGRAIITTDAPGCRETVINGENGFLVQVKNVDVLVQMMEKFINNPTLVATMGYRARQIAEEKYDVHKVNVFMLAEMGIQ